MDVETMLGPIALPVPAVRKLFKNWGWTHVHGRRGRGGNATCKERRMIREEAWKHKHVPRGTLAGTHGPRDGKHAELGFSDSQTKSKNHSLHRAQLTEMASMAKGQEERLDDA
jgi:hypothetical protein